MGLDTAINTSVSGIKAVQTALGVLSNNIANANVEGYNRRVVVQSVQVLGTRPAGTFIEAAQRQVDQFILEQSRQQYSSLGFTQIQKTYLDRTSAFYGQPDSGTSLNSYLDNFFTAFNDAAGTPEQAFFRTLAVQRGEELANRISSLAEDIAETQFEIDQEIDSAVTELDTLLFSLSTVHQGLDKVLPGTEDEAELLDERDRVLDEIAEIIDVTVRYDAKGKATVFTNEVIFIEPGGNRTRIEYQPVTSLQAVINGATFGAITATTYNDRGNQVGNATDLATTGTSDNVTTILSNGKLAGLLDLRDNVLPDLVEQLDELTSNLIDQTNIIHNQGTGYPPPNALTGTTLVTLNEERAFTGEVQIALLQDDGLPIESPYTGEEFLKPLTIDFDNLEGSYSTNGQVDVQRIVDEINQYYGVQQNNVNIGPIRNIQLAAVSDPTDGTGVLDVNLDIDSIQTDSITISDATVVIGGPIVFTPAVGPVATVDADYGTGFTIEPGDQIRTLSTTDIELDFSAAATNTYTVDIPITVTDGLGNTLTSTVSYEIDYDAFTGNFNIPSSTNDRIPATAADNDGSIDTVASIPLAEARLVDADGNEITDPDEEGYLQIRGEDGTDYRIAITQIDSNEGGLVNAGAVTSGTATNRGFSHFFGMNNYFVEPTSGDPVAANMAVTQSLIDDPSSFSAGQLVQAAQPADALTTAIGNYTFSLGVGNNQNATELALLRNEVLTFDAAGGLSTLGTNIENYAAQMTSYVSLLSNTADDDLNRELVVRNVFDSQLDSIGGVNIDEELANTIFFENAYAGNAQIINLVKELFDLLFDAVG